jgi:hypothetical protein
MGREEIHGPAFHEERNAGMSVERDETPYIVAHYVGIPGEAIGRWLGAMKMCGYVLSRTTEAEHSAGQRLESGANERHV